MLSAFPTSPCSPAVQHAPFGSFPVPGQPGGAAMAGAAEAVLNGRLHPQVVVGAQPRPRRHLAPRHAQPSAPARSAAPASLLQQISESASRLDVSAASVPQLIVDQCTSDGPADVVEAPRSRAGLKRPLDSPSSDRDVRRKTQSQADMLSMALTWLSMSVHVGTAVGSAGSKKKKGMSLPAPPTGDAVDFQGDLPHNTALLSLLQEQLSQATLAGLPPPNVPPPAPPPAPRFDRFRELPLELREMIYAAAMDDVSSSVKVSAGDFKGERPKLLPAVCFASQQTFAEAVPMFLRTRSFNLGSDYHTTSAFYKFLESVPNGAGFRSVRSVKFLHLHHYAPAPAPAPDAEAPATTSASGSTAWFNHYPHSILQHCSTVRHITLEIRASYFRHFRTVDELRRGLDLYCRTPLQDVLDKFRLGPLFELRRLRSIELLCSMGDMWAANFGCEPTAFFDEFLAWFRAQLDKHGLRVTLDVKYPTRLEVNAIV